MIRFLLPMLLSLSAIASPQEQFTSEKVTITNGVARIPANTKVYRIVGQIVVQDTPNDLLSLLLKNQTTNLKNIVFSMRQDLQNKEEIVLLINSGGGQLSPMSDNLSLILKEFKAQGVPTTCIITGMAASLAAKIFTSCENRLATIDSVFMWHSVSFNLNTRINESTLNSILSEVKAMNDDFWKDLKSFFTKEYFKENFDHETLISEKNGKEFIHIINEVEITQ